MGTRPHPTPATLCRTARILNVYPLTALGAPIMTTRTLFRASLSILALVLATLAAAHAQESATDRRNIADRVGNSIEQVIDRITNASSWPGHNEADEALQDTIPGSKLRTMDIEDLESSPRTRTYIVPTTIGDSETVDGNVVVKGADLLVRGTVTGDALVVGGTLRVTTHGTIKGNARVINGSLVQDDGGTIGGFADRIGGRSSRYREPRRRFEERSTTFDVPWLTSQTDLENVLFRYNRVEGIFVGIGSNHKYYWSGERNWTSYGTVGYGFKAHTWRGSLGIATQIPIDGFEGHTLLEFGLEGYSLTDTKDQWLIGSMEATLAALLIHEDFRDYFQRAGAGIHGSYLFLGGNMRAEVTVSYLGDRFESLRNRVDWAFFGGSKTFRPNPPVDAGKVHSLQVNGGYTNTIRTETGPEGWTITGNAEAAKNSWGSDADFTRYVADVRRYQPVGTYENLNIRLRIGTETGDLPVQRSFDLGGLGTVPAFPFKGESGNRLILVNGELILNGNVLEDIDFWPSWLFRHVNFILLSDAGFVRMVSPAASAFEGFSGIRWSDLRHDFGVGISNRSGSFRIGFAWRTDRSEPATVLLRVYRPF
jgi:hypothetical protein